MEKKFANYGLYGEQYEPRLPGFIHSEIHEDRCKQFGWVIKPHVHTNLFQIVLTDSGETEFTSGLQTISLREPCLITTPVDMLHGYVFSSDVKGMVISLSDSYLENLFPDTPAILIELSRVQLIRSSQDEAAFARLSTLAWQVHTELYASLPGRARALQSYVGLLLVTVFRLAHQQAVEALAINNRNLQHYRQFQQFLKEGIAGRLTINDYARKLGITPVHLNRVCRSVSGKSTLQIIQDSILLEAQRYLHHSTYSISEISYLLNFEDSSYFSRLFKKRLGISPKQFREQSSQAFLKLT